ncbi:hypothetical protein SAMN05444008_106213 [Cnuella takakiae]|uniref:Uncharacterized protein n=1 Tax=Cnuella takakiae TaxID=1302690 RepID=A0A1M5AD70_9BACT|nr:hypothetical protein [Cnuella takakiae]OLY92010.1 hypothetical protein BUE76_08945 [Cnuella takakiae]SHF28115.1 hypothetical protein SAMN05444008_106213 [Cnuella takakiae]
MRRIIAIFCLALLLFTNTELYQLVKMPVLLEHYQEHKAGGMNLLGFLKEHYFNGGVRNPDYERDMQLPFKTPTHIATIAFVLAVPEHPEVVQAPVLEQEDIAYNTYADWLPATYLQDIFQPPRA